MAGEIRMELSSLSATVVKSNNVAFRASICAIFHNIYMAALLQAYFGVA